MERSKPIRSHPEPRLPFGTVVPAAPGEAAALTTSWERRGILRRLVRVGLRP
jgi:hypothetical protein